MDIELTDSERRYLGMHARYESGRQEDFRYHHEDPEEREGLRARWREIGDALHPEPWKEVQAPGLARITVSQPPPGPVDRGFDTTNDFGWGINGYGIITPALPLPPMDRMTALRAAAYLVLLAVSQGDLFAAVLERVKHT